MHQISVIFSNIVYFSHGWRGLFDDNKDNLRSRSAIEAHRPRSASWKRSMPPLSPQIKNLRGPRTLESYGEADRSNACEIKILLGRYRGKNRQQLKQHNPTTVARKTTHCALEEKVTSKNYSKL